MLRERSWHHWLRPAGAWLSAGSLFLVAELSAPAQDFHVRDWHVANGLPDGTVTALAQTADGYLWVGTPAGLACFDGERFTRFDTAGHTALKDRSIVGLLADRRGSLWIASESGMITELEGDEFHTRYVPEGVFAGSRGAKPQPSPGAPGRNPNSVLALDRDGNVWVTTLKGEVMRFAGSGSRQTAMPPQETPIGRVRGLINDEAGRIWLLKGTNAYVFEEGRWTVYTSPEFAGPGRILCAAGDQGFWTAEVSGPQALAKLVRHGPGETWDVSSLPIPSTPARPSVSAMLQDHKGRVWLAKTWGGVYVQLRKGEWARVQASGALAKGTVRCFFEDRQGSIWVGTTGQGLHQVLEASVKMVLLPPEASDVHVTTVCAARDGALWMGTDKGLYKGGESSTVKAVEELSGESVLSVLEDSRTNLWVGTRTGLFRREDSGFKRVPSTPPVQGRTLALYEDRAGGIWAGGSPGSLLHWKSGSPAPAFETITKNPALSIWCITEGSDGQIWAATWRRGSSLWRLDGKRLVPTDPQLQAIDQLVRSVLWDQEGALWIGTQGDGLFRWHNKILQHYTSADGLADDVIFGLMEDERGNLWMPSRTGILGCSRRQLAEYVRGKSPPLLCMQLGSDEGLANPECTGAGQPVISRGPDGRLWVATMMGAAGFSPEILARAGPSADVRVVSLRTDGKRVEAVPGGFRVLSSTRRYDFRYSVPELAAPKMLRFRYRLRGMDRDWVEAGTERTASYGQLPPGEYEFCMMVGGADGLWREGKTPQRLRVLPRFWQTAWFRTLAAAGVVIALVGGGALNERRKARRRLERLEAQQAVEQVRRGIARDLHDELGSGITEIVQLGDLTLQPESQRETLWLSVESMTAQARQLGKTLDEIVWTMSSRNDTLPNLVGYISNHAQEFFRHSGLRCRLDVTQSLPGVGVDSQTRHDLLLAVKEALNNVAKHSGANEVMMRLHYAEGVLRVHVEDNGCGFDVSSVASGEGLRNMRERLQSMKGEADILSRKQGGTQVVFTLPLGGELAARPEEAPH